MFIKHTRPLSSPTTSPPPLFSPTFSESTFRQLGAERWGWFWRVLRNSRRRDRMVIKMSCDTREGGTNAGCTVAPFEEGSFNWDFWNWKFLTHDFNHEDKRLEILNNDRLFIVICHLDLRAIYGNWYWLGWIVPSVTTVGANKLPSSVISSEDHVLAGPTDWKDKLYFLLKRMLWITKHTIIEWSGLELFLHITTTKNISRPNLPKRTCKNNTASETLNQNKSELYNKIRHSVHFSSSRVHLTLTTLAVMFQALKHYSNIQIDSLIRCPGLQGTLFLSTLELTVLAMGIKQITL